MLLFNPIKDPGHQLWTKTFNQSALINRWNADTARKYHRSHTEMIDPYRDGVTKIVMPNGVTSIEVRIQRLQGLTSIGFLVASRPLVIEHSLIGSLTNITIPEGIIEIGAGAFIDCSGLTAIEIPSSVIEIGDSAFMSCTGLTDVTIPEGVT